MGHADGSTTPVVVAEDNFLTAHLIVATLEKAGYRVFAGRDGDAVLRLVDQHRPRVLVLNLNLSRPNGTELLRALRKRGSAPRAIVFLSATQADLRPQAELLGAEAFFESPFEPAALVAAVERLSGE